MIALLDIVASDTGLADLSPSFRAMASDPSRIITIDGFSYYDLRGDSVWSWAAEPAFNADAVFTIEGWVLLTSGAYQSIFASLASGSFTKGLSLDLASDGIVLINGGAQGDDSTSYVPSVDTTKPVHFAWVLDGSTKKLYINGLLAGSTPIVSAPAKSPNLLIFGGGQNSISNTAYPSSKAKVSRFTFWDGVKYTGEFTPDRGAVGLPELKRLDGFSLHKLFTADKNGVIADKVLIKGVPTMRKVCLYLRATNELVAKTWSDNAGNYRFNNLQAGNEYYVLALDHERNYNAVIQDMLRAEQ